MKAEEQRIAIAEACGWTKTKSGKFWKHPNKNQTCQHRYRLPDFPNDLNAMAEACKMLASQGWHCIANMGTDRTWECFFTKADDFGIIPCDKDFYGAADKLSGAMAQAFLLCIGKWVD
jgi:hypothetical protein